MKRKDKEVMTRAVGGLAKSAIMDFNDLKSDHETTMKEKDDRIKELKKMIGGFEDIVLEELHKQIAALKAERDELQHMLLAGEPPYYTKWRQQAEEIERIREINKWIPVQFRFYATTNPNEESKHSLNFCANFLDEYLNKGPAGDLLLLEEVKR